MNILHFIIFFIYLNTFTLYFSHFISLIYFISLINLTPNILHIKLYLHIKILTLLFLHLHNHQNILHLIHLHSNILLLNHHVLKNHLILILYNFFNNIHHIDRNRINNNDCFQYFLIKVQFCKYHSICQEFHLSLYLYIQVNEFSSSKTVSYFEQLSIILLIYFTLKSIGFSHYTLNKF